MHACVRVCVRACRRAGVSEFVRACVRACLPACVKTVTMIQYSTTKEGKVVLQTAIIMATAL